MPASVSTTNILLGVLGAWVLFNYPVGYILLTAAVAAVAFIATSEMKAALGAVVVMILLRVLGDVLKPAKPAWGPREGFQAKDPITIHQRITEKKQPVGKPDTITGVLESPSVLGNLHISELRPNEEGFTNSTQPALNTMNTTTIPTPAESSMPQPVSSDAAVKQNPALITGADPAAVETAMTNKGSALYAPAAAETGSVGGAGPASFE